MRRLAIIALSIATAFSGMPALAGPAYTANPIQSAAQPQTAGGQAELLQVGCNNFTKCRRFNYDGTGRPNYRYSDRYRDDRRWDRDRRYYGDRYYRDRYYRRDDNTGAIIGGLAAGAIIGGIIASQPRVRTGSSHVDYCYSRYRSYRASDNTYQPTYGPRRQCQ